MKINKSGQYNVKLFISFHGNMAFHTLNRSYFPSILFQILRKERCNNMADNGTLGTESNNKQPETVEKTQESVTDDDRKQAEELKEKANDFFKSRCLLISFF